MEGRYKIDSIVNKNTGEPTERSVRRNGHLVDIIHLVVGDPMLMNYTNEPWSTLQTSGVMDYSHTVEGGLVVTTRNSQYTLKPEGA